MILFLICALFSFQTIAKVSHGRLFIQFYKSNLPYSSYLFLKRDILKNGRPSYPKEAKALLNSLHNSVYIQDEELDKFKGKNTLLNYAVGLRSFMNNEKEVARNHFVKVRRTHPGHVDSLFLLSVISLIDGNKQESLSYLNRCIDFSSETKGIKSKMLRTKYNIFRDRCLHQKSRLFYSERRYNQSIAVLNKIDKTDFVWPQTLFDRAWSFYRLKKYPQALGTVLTYNAPLLKRFLEPEMLYLKALIYFELCYFDKAKNIYQEYLNNMWKNKDFLKSMLEKNFIGIILGKEKPQNNNQRFIHDIVRTNKRDLRFISFLQETIKIRKEIKYFKKRRKGKFSRKILPLLELYQRAILGDLDRLFKSSISNYYEQIIKVRPSFVKLQLAQGLQQRKNLRSSVNTETSEEIVEKSLSDISYGGRDFVFDFRGGFWADELGDYAVAVKSRCEK